MDERLKREIPHIDYHKNPREKWEDPRICRTRGHLWQGPFTYTKDGERGVYIECVVCAGEDHFAAGQSFLD